MKPKVIKITQTTAFSANGQAQPSYLVQFNVGDQGPFTVQIPGDQFNAQNVQAAMDKFAAEVNPLFTPGA
jgi:hypothetical protein